MGSSGKAPGGGPGSEAPGSSLCVCFFFFFFNAETAFSTQTYIGLHEIVRFKTFLQTKIRQSMFVERFG